MDQHIQDELRKIKENFQPVFGDKCFVAGGAVRDIVLGGLIKDFDIFVPHENDLEDEIAVEAINKSSGGYFNLAGEDYSGIDPNFNERVVSVYKGVVWAYNNDVIFRTEQGDNFTPENILNTFDHSLCRMWWDWERNSPVISPEAQKTLDTGVVTVYNTDERNMKRLRSLSTKYPQFTFTDVNGKVIDVKQKKAAFEMNWDKLRHDSKPIS